MSTTAATGVDLNKLLTSMRLKAAPAAPKPMLAESLTKITEDVSEEDRFISGIAALVLNVDRTGDGKFDKAKIQDIILTIDSLVNAQINEVIHNEKFKTLESTWRGLDDLCKNVNFKANIMIDFIDVAKEELYEDFENNSVDIASGAFFKKAYIEEYDQYGGKPFGGLIGLYEFEHTPKDLFFLRQMGKVAAASHAPFISAVSPKFFGCNTIDELSALKDLEGMMNQPKYSGWNALRDTPEAAYLGLALPRYMARLPWDPESNPCSEINFKEEMGDCKDDKYTWGNAAVLFARNMCRSFETSGWCQYLRGPKGGGLVSGLPVHSFNIRGEKEIKIPVEMAVPDYRELEFANSGFMPVVYRKGTGDACFFSVQSCKRSKKFKDAKDSENAQLVTNLSYTFSVTRIAHYVKCIQRDNIGSTADGAYIQKQLDTWISQYVTKIANPDDLTLRYYPFKAAKVDVTAREGQAGWYSASISILPHIQFEGMDVELRLESRL